MQVDDKFLYKILENQGNRDMNGAFQKHLYHHQMIQRNYTEMLFTKMHAFLSHASHDPLPRVFEMC